MKHLLKNAMIINPAGEFSGRGDILIEDGKIAAIGSLLQDAAATVIDLNGKTVTPGLIDMHVHLRDPGLEAKEDIYSGTRAAVAGGFTYVACMANTKPVVDQSILVEGILNRAAEYGAAKVGVIGALSKGQCGQELAEIGDMIASGAVAISDDGHKGCNAKLMRTALEYTSMFDKVIISHAEEESLVEDGIMHEGAVSAKLGMKGRPAVAEDIAAARDVLLAEFVGASLHIAHISSKGAVEQVRSAKQRGVAVSAEVTPHHLTLTDSEIERFDTAFKVNPPLRSLDHQEALIAGLKDGTIEVIASDHAPHAFEEKDVEFKTAPSGFTGLETSLGVVLDELYHKRGFSLEDIVRWMSVNPARILGIDAGKIMVGTAADLTVIEPDAVWTVEPEKFYTRGQHSPFKGRNLRGKAVMTIVDGRIVMKDGEVTV